MVLMAKRFSVVCVLTCALAGAAFPQNGSSVNAASAKAAPVTARALYEEADRYVERKYTYPDNTHQVRRIAGKPTVT